MNRRILSFSVVACASILAYACSSSTEGDPTPGPADEAGTDGPGPLDDGGPGTDTGVTDGSIPPSGNPIEGIAAATEITALAGLYTEGPQWHVDGLYFSTTGAGGSFIKLTPPATTLDLGGVTAGNVTIGNAFDKVGGGGTFVSCEAVAAGAGGILVRRTVAGVATPIALTFTGLDAFASPNDVVARADGTLYVTDPGYQAGAASADNRIWRVKPNGEVVGTSAPGRPNGIALSPDEKFLYVSFTAPDAPALPMISKYAIATDGTIGGVTKFNDVGPVDSVPDGLAVDTAGNVYVGVKNGVDVFKADGSGKWGHIASTKIISGLGFGGADKKTLFMTTNTGMLQVTVKIAGIE